jgi:hypothetical protein
LSTILDGHCRSGNAMGAKALYFWKFMIRLALGEFGKFSGRTCAPIDGARDEVADRAGRGSWETSGEEAGNDDRTPLWTPSQGRGKRIK